MTLVRKPTNSAHKLTLKEQSAGVSNLALRLSETGDRPIIVFRYKKAWSLARTYLDKMGYGRMFYMPSPYAKAACSDMLMNELQKELRLRFLASAP